MAVGSKSQSYGGHYPTFHQTSAKTQGCLVAGWLGSKLVSKLHPALAYKSLFKTIFGMAGGVVGILLLMNILDNAGSRPDAIAIQIAVLLIAAVLGGYISTLLLSLLVKGSKR